jgi:hypothetical protein
LRGCRIGEASHPGPTILVANVTSMAAAWGDILATEWDVAVLHPEVQKLSF